MSAPCRIAVLGAPGTGRTTLERELTAHLGAHGFAVVTTDSIEQCDAALLLGLDLPASDGAPQREAADARLRTLLQRAQVRYHVVYGTGPQRLHAALLALEAAGVLPPGTAPRPSEDGARRWTWACEKCSDPDCEHRLFTQLQDRRG